MSLAPWLLETRHAARRLLRRPGHAGASILTLTLGIAASTAVFALVYGVLLSPLPYPDSRRIVEVDHAAPRLNMDRGLGITFGFYRLYEERLRSVESIAMYVEHGVTWTGVGEPIQLSAVRATPSLARVLGTEPALGRWFTGDEAGPGRPPTVVLSDGLWRERFGEDPSVIGRSVDLDGVGHQVVGVMPASFGFPSQRIALWTPREVPATGIGGWNERAVARLAVGATPESLGEEIRALLPLLREHDDDAGLVRSYLDDAGVVPRVRSLRDAVVGHVRTTLWVLFGTVGFVLAVAIANVANLFVVRAEETGRESALRSALGATRSRIAQGHLAEAMLVSGIATGAGVGLAFLAVDIVRTRAPVAIPRLHEVGIDPAVVAVAAGVAMLTALALGLLPSLRPAGELAPRLEEDAGRATAGRRRLRGRSVLVATQVALALVLLVGSGLLLRTFAELRSVELGFSQRQALTFRIGVPEAAYPGRAAAAGFHQDVEERLRAIPGVASVGAVASCLPLSGNLCWGEVLTVDGAPPRGDGAPIVTGTRAVSPDYFSTMGIPVRGRGIEPADGSSGTHVAVLSESAAAAHFPGEDPLGRRVSFGSADDAWYTVVGVAGDVRAGADIEGLTNLIYLPVLPDGSDGPTPHDVVAYVLATNVPPVTVATAVRDAVAAVDANIPVAQMASLEELIDRATAPAAFALALVGLAGLMSLILGAVGVYAVTAYAASRRTFEIGVRIALGARGSQVQTMILWQGGPSLVAGAAIGLVGAMGLTRLMTHMLFRVSATDPLTYAAATLLPVCAGGVALWLPARRASRLDPVTAMRSE